MAIRINRASARRAPPAVSAKVPARAPEPLCVPELILRKPCEPGHHGRLSWPLRAFRASGWLVAGPPSRCCSGRSGTGPARPGGSRRSRRPGRRHTSRGYASLCWPASVPATRSRAVWGRQGDWRSGSAPRSHRGGRWFEPSIAHQLKVWRMARSEAVPDRPHPIRGWGLPMPGQVEAHGGSRPCSGTRLPPAGAAAAGEDVAGRQARSSIGAAPVSGWARRICGV